MSTLRWPRRARARLAVLLAVAAAACTDAALPPAAPVPPHFTPLAAVTGDTSFLPAARVRARLLAIALAEPAARARLRDALRRSPLATHRIALERELALPAYDALVRDIARASGIADDSVRRIFAAGPKLDLMLPRSADRRGWRPASPLVLGVADRWRARPRIVYLPTGDSAASLDGFAGAYVVVAPAGDRSQRVAPQRDAPGDAVEDPDDGTLSGTLTYVTASGDTAHVEIARLIPNYRAVPASAPPADGERALADLRAERTRLAAGRSPAAARRLIACLDACDGGGTIDYGITGWTDTTYLVGLYERGGPEAGGDPDFEPWYDGYYRGSRWRLQFNGVPPNTIIYVDIPFMNARVADHSAEGVRVIGGEDEGWWSDGACVVPGMRFLGARYQRGWYPAPVTLLQGDQYVWRHCGGYQDADTWGAMLRWRARPRPPVATLRVEFDTTFMSATTSNLPGLYAVPKYQGAFRYGYTGCPAVYYLVGLTADGERLDSTSLSVLASASSSSSGIAVPSRPFNGILRNYAQGTTNITATIDGVSAQNSYGVLAYVTSIAISPAQRIVGVGASATESAVWTGASGSMCALRYRTVPALRPAWTSSSPSLALSPNAPDTSAVQIVASSVGTYTLSATLGAMTASASVVAELPPTSAPALRGSYTVTGAALDWTTVSGARVYYVYRRVDGGAWEFAGSTTSTTFHDDHLVDFYYGGESPGTAGTEDFVVAARNDAGQGPLSNAVGYRLSSVGSGGGGTGSGEFATSRTPRGGTRLRP